MAADRGSVADEARDPELEQTIGVLAELLEEASGRKVTLDDPAESIDIPLRSLGLDSGAFIAFMNGVEERFEMRWELDEPPETFETLGAIATLLASGSEAS